MNRLAYYFSRMLSRLRGVRLVGVPLALAGLRIKVLAKKSTLRIDSTVSIQDDVFIQGNGMLTIGKKSIIKRAAYLIFNSGNLYIGEFSAVGKRNEISVNGGSIRIGNNVRLASNVFITNANHSFSDPSRPIMEQPIVAKDVVIEDDVWIGNGAMVMPGVTIGKGAIVAAGAIVTKNIDAYTIVAGNPARVLKKRF